LGPVRPFRPNTASLAIPAILMVVAQRLERLSGYMTVVVRERTDLVVPPSVRRRAGIKPGDRLEFRVSGGAIHIVRESPSAGEELTCDQRAAIDKRLSAADDDIRRGRVYGPFSTAADLAASVEANVRKLRAAKRKARSAR